MKYPSHTVSTTTVAQRVTPGRIRWFHKEVIRGDGPHPVAIVRKRLADGRAHAPVIRVHGFGQNRYAWHLPERSFANHLAEHGFDVFNVDLRGHGRSADFGADRSTGVDPYIREDLPAAIEVALERSGFKRAFLVGHSLGGICVAAAGARDPARVAGVVTLGPPHALGRGHFVLGNLMRAAGHSVGSLGWLRGSQARVPVDLIGRGVYATRVVWDSPLSPMGIQAWKPRTFSPGALRSYVATSFDGASWGTLHDLFELATSGELRSRVDGVSYTRQCELSRLPLLTVSGSADKLANPDSVKPLVDRSQSPDKTYATVDAGHADMLVGTQAPEAMWPLVTNWLHARIDAVGSRNLLAQRRSNVLRAG